MTCVDFVEMVADSGKTVVVVDAFAVVVGEMMIAEVVVGGRHGNFYPKPINQTKPDHIYGPGPDPYHTYLFGYGSSFEYIFIQKIWA